MALTDYVLMPGADYLALCNAIRAKTGKTETLKSGDLAAEVESITGGGNGGSVEGVHTVTFMSEDGSAVLYERLVVDGDDCANVVDRGLLATPTKESTAQYNYTYSGWSLTSGGSASASALKSVTSDRTVYAAFNSSTRYYTITYYDGDTVLKTESLPYGAMPSYTPEKDGASFDGWTPALTTVTGNASYTAVWQEKVTFAGGSWADIAAISESGQAADYFAVGDKRTITINGYSIVIAIAGFNHDDLADGSGKAGMSIVLETVYPQETEWHSRSMFYHTGALNTALNNIKTAMPSELSAVIKQVVKKIDYKKTSGTSPDCFKDFNCYLWALSLDELGVNVDALLSTSRDAFVRVLGTKYDLFEYDSDQRRTLPDGTYGKYWTRQMFAAGSGDAFYQDGTDTYKTRGWKSQEPTQTANILFGFCI